MRENVLSDIALTAVSDWQQAQTLMLNTYRKIFNGLLNIPFEGIVYPAELVTATAQLKREVARQRQALEEKERRIRYLLEKNSGYIIASGKTRQIVMQFEIPRRNPEDRWRRF